MDKLRYAGHMGSHALSSFAKGYSRGQAFGGHVVKGAQALDAGMQGVHVHNMVVGAGAINPVVPRSVMNIATRYHAGREAARALHLRLGLGAHAR